MFEQKITLKIPEERVVRKKRFGGREILMYESMTESEMVYCMKEIISIYYNDNFISNEDSFVTPLELFSNLDILALQLCTNVDVTNIGFEELLSLDAHRFLKNGLSGFSELEKSAMIGVQHVHTMKMLEGLDHIASIDELEETEENVKEMLKNGPPENVRDLVLSKLADDPSIAKFYEEFNTVLKEQQYGIDE